MRDRCKREFWSGFQKEMLLLILRASASLITFWAHYPHLAALALLVSGTGSQATGDFMSIGEEVGL